MNNRVKAIDIVVNLWTEEAMRFRSKTNQSFFVDKIGISNETYSGISIDQMLESMDKSDIEVSFLIANKNGQLGLPSSSHLPYELVADAVKKHPDRFKGLAGIDPTEGMKGVRSLEKAVKELGFIGAHFYPHWFDMPPNHARVYPFYAKCVELEIPIQMQVGQSLVYNPERRLRSVGRPIYLDDIACDFPELKVVGIHIGIPWTDEMIAMAWKHENIFIGSDAHSPKYWPTQFINYINTYGKHKVMFGTDFPVLGFEKTRKQIDELNLREESAKLFFRENAIKLYNL
ncbi:MAG: amidohydrolase [Rhodospirillaceae bacterium]|nr:amidohydrolase [Rhodospirillaceae bacterium]